MLSILLKYNPIKTLVILIILEYFEKSLKSSILAKLEYQNLKLKSIN